MATEKQMCWVVERIDMDGRDASIFTLFPLLTKFNKLVIKSRLERVSKMAEDSAARPKKRPRVKRACDRCFR